MYVKMAFDTLSTLPPPSSLNNRLLERLPPYSSAGVGPSVRGSNQQMWHNLSSSLQTHVLKLRNIRARNINQRPVGVNNAIRDK